MIAFGMAVQESISLPSDLNLISHVIVCLSSCDFSGKFQGSSATSAAILECDKPRKLSADLPGRGSEAGNHCYIRSALWHC